MKSVLFFAAIFPLFCDSVWSLQCLNYTSAGPPASTITCKNPFCFAAIVETATVNGAKWDQEMQGCADILTFETNGTSVCQASGFQNSTDAAGLTVIYCCNTDLCNFITPDNSTVSSTTIIGSYLISSTTEAFISSSQSTSAPPQTNHAFHAEPMGNGIFFIFVLFKIRFLS